MLASLREKKNRSGGGDVDDITLVLSTREPDVLVPLVVRALESSGDHLEGLEGHRGTLSIHVFSRSPVSSSLSAMAVGRTVPAVKVTQHACRLSKDTLHALDIENVQEWEAYVCGPDGFEQVVLGALKDMGVDSRKVRREGFVY